MASVSPQVWCLDPALNMLPENIVKRKNQLFLILITVIIDHAIIDI
jgi:hypothetical protein